MPESREQGRLPEHGHASRNREHETISHTKEDEHPHIVREEKLGFHRIKLRKLLRR